MKQFSCGAVVPGCTATFTAEDEQGILEQVAGHAKADHGIDEPGPELVEAVKANIQDS
jgi:predicted small metal-binding protein